LEGRVLGKAFRARIPRCKLVKTGRWGIVSSGAERSGEGEEAVRVVGIDAAEVWKETAGQWVYEPRPFGEEVRNAGGKPVRGRKVYPEPDARERGKHGPLLAHQWTNGEGDDQVTHATGQTAAAV